MFCVLDETLTLRLGDWTIETGPGTFPVCLQALYRGSATTATAPFAGWASTPQPASRRTCAIWAARSAPVAPDVIAGVRSATHRLPYGDRSGACQQSDGPVPSARGVARPRLRGPCAGRPPFGRLGLPPRVALSYARIPPHR
jgi:hypothetical protein